MASRRGSSSSRRGSSSGSSEGKEKKSSSRRGSSSSAAGDQRPALDEAFLETFQQSTHEEKSNTKGKREKKASKNWRKKDSWSPISEEYRLDSLNQALSADVTDPGHGKPPPPPPPPTLEPDYRSSEYNKETKKPSIIPVEKTRGPYRSLEYQRENPIPFPSYEGVPHGYTPEDGPWIQFFNSMWDISWVTLKGLEVGEAAKTDFTGFNFEVDKEW